MTVGLVTAIAVASVLGSTFKIDFLANIVNALPFAEASLPWLVPAIIGILLLLFFQINKKVKLLKWNKKLASAKFFSI